MKNINTIIFFLIILNFGLPLKAEPTVPVSLICALDMGSNSFKFIIAEMVDGKFTPAIDEVRDTLGVGDDISISKEKTGLAKISDGKFKEIESAIKKYKDLCNKETGQTNIIAVATAAFREAVNKDDFLNLMTKLNVSAEIATGERESKLAYQATVFGKPNQAVVDFGSRTTEFVTKDKNKEYTFKELQTGYKTAYKKYFENALTFLEASNSYVKEIKNLVTKSDFNILNNKEDLYIIEGAEMAAYMAQKPMKEIEGIVITKQQIAKKIKELSKLSPAEYSELKNIKDIERVVSRLVFLNYLFENTNYTQARFTTRELYAGLISERTN